MSSVPDTKRNPAAGGCSHDAAARPSISDPPTPEERYAENALKFALTTHSLGDIYLAAMLNDLHAMIASLDAEVERMTAAFNRWDKARR